MTAVVKTKTTGSGKKSRSAESSKMQLAPEKKSGPQKKISHQKNTSQVTTGMLNRLAACEPAAGQARNTPTKVSQHWAPNPGGPGTE